MTPAADYLTTHGFTAVAKSRSFTHWVNGKLRCTVIQSPQGWGIGAEGTSRSEQTWDEVKQTIERLQV